MFKNWTLFEKVWLILFSLIGVCTYCFDTESSSILSFIAMITGILCVLLTAKGSIYSFIFGYVNVILYGYIACNNGLYGEAGLNVLFFLPMNIIGNLIWIKHLSNNDIVEMKKLSLKWVIYITVVSIFSIFILGLSLSLIETQNTPYMDSFTNVLSVVAALLLTFRYREQWLCWIVLDIVTVIMWCIRFYNGGQDAFLMIVMWFAYLINAFYGWYIWTKNLKVENKI